jgi:RNA polymerase sigma-70 factor, ECF subfamily
VPEVLCDAGIKTVRQQSSLRRDAAAAQERCRIIALGSGKDIARFDSAILPHLDAAHNLARWLMRNDQDAEDAVQDACVRALRFVHGMRAEDGRGWLLKIVRNVCYSRLRRATSEAGDEFDESVHGAPEVSLDPEVILAHSRDAAALTRALEELPEEFREIIVLREIEGLSYKEVADIAGVPIGTVMSRLARARKRLQALLATMWGRGL